MTVEMLRASRGLGRGANTTLALFRHPTVALADFMIECSHLSAQVFEYLFLHTANIIHQKRTNIMRKLQTLRDLSMGKQVRERVYLKYS